MRRLDCAPLFAIVVVVGSVSPVLAADPGVTLIGVGVVPGDGFDRSGLQGQAICRLDDETVCTDQATLGGFGSAMTYTGHDDVFIATNDRGTFDGRNDVPYLDRFHFFHITVDVGAPFPNVRSVLLDTRFLRNEREQNFVGDHVLFVVTDNDLFPGRPTQIYAFAIDEAAAGVRYEPQRVKGPMFPPGQVRRAIR